MDWTAIIAATDGWRIVQDRPEWQHRAALAAKLITPRQSVFELGCYSQHLATLLPSGCSYSGADLHPRGPGVQVVDLNHELPDWPEGIDVVAILGVLEYLNTGRAAAILQATPTRELIVSYGFRPAAARPALEFQQIDFLLMAQRLGWRLSAIVQYDHRQPLRIIMHLKRR